MQKSTSYFEVKLRLLHKMNGLNSLYDKYKESNKYETRVQRPPMFYTFPRRDMVSKWFEAGKPMSCFCLNNDYHKIHVAVAIGDCLEKKSDGEDFAYLTFNYNIDNMFRVESGVHFCEFELVEGVTTAKKFDLNFTDYAVMLSFKNKGVYCKQYTLIYSDWEVLICETNNVKGRTPVSRDLYADLLSGRVY